MSFYHIRKQHRLRKFQSRVLRKIFGPEKDDVNGNGEDFVKMSFMALTPHQTLYG